jgi:hypothetical protein
MMHGMDPCPVLDSCPCMPLSTDPLPFSTPVDHMTLQGRAPVDLVSQELQPFLLAAAASSSSLGQQAVRQQVCRQAAPVELPPGSSKSQLFSWGNGANFQLGTGGSMALGPVCVPKHLKCHQQLPSHCHERP